MKKLFIFLFSMCAIGGFSQKKFNLEDFAIPLEQITSGGKHVWVNSGYTTVNPEPRTVLGVREFFSPPFAAKKLQFNVDLEIDGTRIVDAGACGEEYGKGDVGFMYSGGVWYPDRIVRNGTYHHRKDGQLLSVGITSELIPLFGKAGFIEKVRVKNRTQRPLKIKLVKHLEPGSPYVVPLYNWQFGPPKDNGQEALKSTDNVWSNQDATIRLIQDNTVSEVLPEEILEAYFTVLVDHPNSEHDKVDAKALASKTREAWKLRLAKYTKNIPVLESDIEGLAAYYKRSILSALVCIWENPEFDLNPFFAEGGMDGGAICTYPWGLAYYSNTATLMFEDHMEKIVQKIVDVNLEKYYAFTLNGSAIGVKYAYSPFSLTKLVSSIFKIKGVNEDLFNATAKLVLNNEKQAGHNNLIDYGVQHNLLEMRGAGYEHYVVSPNAERSWCFDEMHSMGTAMGLKTKELSEWEAQSERICDAIRNELWDDDRNWFAAIYPDGYKDYVYTIQVFDVLRTNVCTPNMEQEILSHLREDAFLGNYGVSSISKEDSIHYEVLDTDWSGGGAYTGDGPELALTMYEIRQPELAWDVLKRFFWMGENLLYYPQEHFCNKPSAPQHKRANIAAGLTGAEAILFGLLGFQPQYNGELYIDPNPVAEGSIRIKGFRLHDNAYDVDFSVDNMTVKKNGLEIYNGLPCRLKL